MPVPVKQPDAQALRPFGPASAAGIGKGPARLPLQRVENRRGIAHRTGRLPVRWRCRRDDCRKMARRAWRRGWALGRRDRSRRRAPGSSRRHRLHARSRRYRQRRLPPRRPTSRPRSGGIERVAADRARSPVRSPAKGRIPGSSSGRTGRSPASRKRALRDRNPASPPSLRKSREPAVTGKPANGPPRSLASVGTPAKVVR